MASFQVDIKEVGRGSVLNVQRTLSEKSVNMSTAPQELSLLGGLLVSFDLQVQIYYCISFSTKLHVLCHLNQKAAHL